MHVILTVDVESYTGDYEREVWADGLGLPFILDACRRHGVVATWFVEALGATRWGRAPLRRIVEKLRLEGQDVQLHLHPVVARIDGFEDREDVLCHRDLATQTMLIERVLILTSITSNWSQLSSHLSLTVIRSAKSSPPTRLWASS